MSNKLWLFILLIGFKVCCDISVRTMLNISPYATHYIGPYYNEHNTGHILSCEVTCYFDPVEAIFV